jgi:formylglycine-generating enzyme required for sulfatase activity
VNTNFVAVIKRIITEQGEAIFANPQRVKGLVQDYAARESKVERLAFCRCIEYGAYTELKNTLDARARLMVKTALAQRVRSNEGLDVSLCNDALDTLEAALFGTVTTQVRNPPPRQTPTLAQEPSSRIEQHIPEDFIRIEGGTFMMGSPSSETYRSENEVLHQVTVSSFYMGMFEVTQSEYEAVMGTNPSYFKGYRLPVEQVRWYDAIKYCNKRSEKEGLTPAYTVNGKNATWNRNANGYRLPTEAEWEYACRAGTTTPFSTGSNITSDQANYDGNYPYNGNAKRGIYRKETTEVSSFSPNRLGLYDMHGNVWEWCWDWFGDYSSGPQTNPVGVVSGVCRVIRGGSWSNYVQHIRSAYRDIDPPSNRSFKLGFRLVRP